MSQQINLLNPALIQKTDFLNPNNIALLLGVLLLGLIAYFQVENSALTKLKTTREQLAAQVSAMETQVTQMRAAKAAQTGNHVLLDTIKSLEGQTTMQEEIIKAVSQNSTPSNKSYAALLKAFSKQSIDGLWITGLTIDQDAEALSIKGRALHADLLPAFIARLRAEPALKGKTFTDLKMQSAEITKEKTSNADTATNLAQALTSTPPADNSSTGTKVSINAAAQEKTAAPSYVEFTLHSVTEKETLKEASNAAIATVGAAH